MPEYCYYEPEYMHISSKITIQILLSNFSTEKVKQRHSYTTVWFYAMFIGTYRNDLTIECDWRLKFESCEVSIPLICRCCISIDASILWVKGVVTPTGDFIKVQLFCNKAD